MESPIAEIYSRRVNDITCTAVAGNRTWLGTRLGIKRVEAGKGVVRHYDQDDGLPGDVVEAIAADADGAVAQVWGAGNQRVLCWWDKKTDRWRPLTPMTGTYIAGPYDTGYQVNRTGERFVLTPTHVILAPSLVLPEDHRPAKANCFRIWTRPGLQKGAVLPRFLPWYEGRRRESDRSQYRTVSAITAMGATVLVSEGQSVYSLSPTALAQAAATPPDDVPDLYTPKVKPGMPRVTLGSDDVALSTLAVNKRSLWVLRGSRKTQTAELVQFVPRFWKRTFLGYQQIVRAVPPLPVLPDSERRRQYPPSAPTDNVTLLPQTDGIWLITPTDFLRYAKGSWERRDDTGRRLARDVPVPIPTSFVSPYGKRWVAPPAQTIPDAVARAWVTLRGVAKGAPSWGEVEAAPALTPGGVAWVRQRFPRFFDPPAAAPAFTPLAVVGEWERYSFGRDWQPNASPQRDPQSNRLWYASVPNPDKTGVLWQFPAGHPLLLQWPLEDYRPAALPLPTSAWNKAQPAPLPDLPVRVSLSVYGFAVRPEGLYIGTKRGILRLPPAASGDQAARDTRLEVVPQPPDARLKFPGLFGARLVQAGPDDTLFVSQDYDRPTLRYDSTQKRFVADAALGTDRVLASTKTVLYTTPVPASRAAPNNTPPPPRPEGVLRLIPRENHPTHAFLLSLPVDKSATIPARGLLLLSDTLRESGGPFVKERHVFHLGIARDTLWFHGEIAPPATSRYPRPASREPSYFGIAGYDLRQRRWTRALEVPAESGEQQPSLLERNETVFVAFYAPDASVWQYDIGRDDWEPMAPGLPREAVSLNGFEKTPFLWKVEDGHAWVLSNGTVYHSASGATAWTALVETEPGDRKRVTALSRVHLAEFDNGLFVGGIQGLWRFDLTTYRWEEILPLATTLGNLPVLRSVYSLAVDRECVYLAGDIRVGNECVYDKRIFAHVRKEGPVAATSVRGKRPGSARGKLLVGWNDGLVHGRGKSASP